MLQDYRERERLARTEVRTVMKKLPKLFEKEFSQRYYRARKGEENIDRLVELARAGDKEALELVRRYVSGLRKYARESGLSVMQIPLCVTELALEILTDGPPKTQAGPDPRDTALRYQTLAGLVNRVSLVHGFPEYTLPGRRDEADVPMSACRLVAQETGYSESAVEKAWGEYKEAFLRCSPSSERAPQ